MFLCNAIGVLLLVLIAFFHLIGVDKEMHGEIIDTRSDSGAGTAAATTSASRSSKQ